MSGARCPYVLCHSCQRPMAASDLPVRDLLVRTPEEVEFANREDSDYRKLLRCRNPDCVAPQRAIVMPRGKEAELVARIRSWLPVATLRLRWQDKPDEPDDDFAVAQFVIDRIRRTPDISFSASVNIGLLRRALDGFGREIQGSCTVFDIFCWGDIFDTAFRLLQPIEAFDVRGGAVPPRFSPFCELIRKHVHKRAIAEIRRFLQRRDCPFLASQGPRESNADLRCPSCSQCGMRPAVASDLEHANVQDCYLYARIVASISPCYHSDEKHLLQFVRFAQEQANLPEAAAIWNEPPGKYQGTCWAGFEEILHPILVHDHLVASAMTGQVVLVPEGANMAQLRSCLAEAGGKAVAAARARLAISDPLELDELREAFDYRKWCIREEQSGCRWLVSEDKLLEKDDRMQDAVVMIEAVAERRYREDRRLREQNFQDELYGHVENAQREETEDSLDFMRAILSRMCEFWAYKQAAYLSSSPATRGKLALRATGTRAISDEESERHLAPIEFQKKPSPLGALLTARSPTDFDEKPGCTWMPTIDAIALLLGWDRSRDVVAYVTPTKFGQDVFVLHQRDQNRVSFKPHSGSPSLLFLESVRQVCSGLSKRMSQWAYFQQQVLNLHVLGHTVRTPIETASTALKNLLHASDDRAREVASRGLKSAMRDISDRFRLAFDLVELLDEKDDPPPAQVDLLEEIRTVAKQCHQRYLHAWDFDAEGATQWMIAIALRRLRLLLSNAIGNAFKYSYKGQQVMITVREQLATADTPEGGTLLTIENVGDGVLPEEIGHLGSLLYRGSSATHKPGSGLGLFLVDWIMRHERRKWRFESEPASGIAAPGSTDNFVNNLCLSLPRRLP
jgi:signal transduction histidine kinase